MSAPARLRRPASAVAERLRQLRPALQQRGRVARVDRLGGAGDAPRAPGGPGGGRITRAPPPLLWPPNPG
ncbi:hypothetical protein, partial [Nocardia asiatica]|uniref:hypothetical protein n=1 Tax=Nocardia asiatica TaxID=209252 RepID=UPI002455E582